MLQTPQDIEVASVTHSWPKVDTKSGKEKLDRGDLFDAVAGKAVTECNLRVLPHCHSIARDILCNIKHERYLEAQANLGEFGGAKSKEGGGGAP